MGYDKSEAKKTNRYTFKWSSGYIGYHIFCIFLFLMLGGVFLPLSIEVLTNADSFLLILLGLLFLAIGAFSILGAAASIMNITHHFEIEPDKVTIVPIVGKAIVLDEVVNIEHVTKKTFGLNRETLSYDTTYTYNDEDGENTGYGLSFRSDKFTSKKYGKFTQYCVNFDELAMVTLANGKKYLINYPKELLEKKG